MFCHFNGKIINSNSINHIDCSRFIEQGYVQVYHMNNDIPEGVSGAAALQLIMTLCPSVLEGKRGRYYKFAWAVHNLIGHPLMQILSMLYLHNWAIWIHEVTIPRPKLPIK